MAKLLSKYKVDFVVVALYVILGIFVIKIIYSIYFSINSIFFNKYYNPNVYGVAIMLSFFTWLLGISGNQTKKAKWRVLQFCISAVYMITFTFAYFSQQFNRAVLLFLFTNPSIDKVPFTMVESMVRTVSFIGPILIVIPVINITAQVILNSENRRELRDFELEIFLPDTEPVGKYTCEVELCVDRDSGRKVIIPEQKRYEHILIAGATGTGKTATVLKPLVARDLYHKWFLREEIKKRAYKLLSENKAYLVENVNDQVFSIDFSMDAVKPVEGYEGEFKKAFKNLIYSGKYHKDPHDASAVEKFIYKDLGLTIVEPSGDFCTDVVELCEKYHIPYDLIDPLSHKSAFFNPMLGDNPAKVASVISTVLRGMYESDNPGSTNVFFSQVTQSAIENIVMLLKLMYPRMHNNQQPTLEDLLAVLHNFNLAVDMCEKLKADSYLSQRYPALLGYFVKNFYPTPRDNENRIIYGTDVGSGRKQTEEFLYGARTQLENLLRRDELTRILCNRNQSVDLSEALRKGRVIVVCTRLGALGSILSKAFGMFFILNFQDAVLNRPIDTEPLLPHFLYVDEFPLYVNKETEACFTLFRKYYCSMTVAIQNLSQLEKNQSMKYYRQVVVNNTKTHVIFGQTNVEDSLYWSKEFGTKRELEVSSSYSQGPVFSEAASGVGATVRESYSARETEKELFSPTDVRNTKFLNVLYETLNRKGMTIKGRGTTSFLTDKYQRELNVKVYPFSKYFNEFAYVSLSQSRKEVKGGNKEGNSEHEEETAFLNGFSIIRNNSGNDKLEIGAAETEQDIQIDLDQLEIDSKEKVDDANTAKASENQILEEFYIEEENDKNIS